MGPVQLKALLISDLVNSTHLVEKLGNDKSTQFFTRHDRIARDLVTANGGQEIDKSDGFLIVFDRPICAVMFALDYHAALLSLSRELKSKVMARIGIHVGDVILRKNSQEDIQRGAKPVEVEGIAKPLTARLMGLALSGQTLLSRSACDLARKAQEEDRTLLRELFWQAHGVYSLKGIDEPIEVFEVGIQGMAPRVAPTNTNSGHRLDHDGTIHGWRPAAGLRIPQRKPWELIDRLGNSGFGEVWLAQHTKTGEKRVYKFCFGSETFRALKREATLFRVLKNTLGNRDDIARILDWNFEEAPFFLEIEYSDGGSLLEWIEIHNGIENIELEQRLEIVAKTAEALAAAHSVGVLHKDIKPGNILIDERQGQPHIKLADFGIGKITDQKRLEELNITALGMTELHLNAGKPSYSGTRIYMAPELLEGKAATVQSDIYAMGVLLYQMVVGDLKRSLAPGWEREIQDDLLVEDISLMVEGLPVRRLRNAQLVCERLRNLEDRRAERILKEQEKQQAETNRKALIKNKKRKKYALFALLFLTLFSAFFMREARRANREAHRAQVEADSAQEVIAFLVELFEVAQPGTEKGSQVTALEILDQGAKKIQEDLQGLPGTRARLMDVMGSVYQKLGLYEKAEKLYKKSLKLKLNYAGEESLDYVKGLINIAHTDLQLGNYATVKSGLEEAQKVVPFLRDLSETELLELNISLLDEWGNLFTDQNQYDKAIEKRALSIELQKKAFGEQDIRIASSLTGLAEIYWLQAKHEKAEVLLKESLDLQKAFYGETHLKVAYASNNLAAVFREQGRYEEAIELYGSVIQIFEKVLEEDHPDIASILNNMATVYNDQGIFEPAGPLFERALQIRIKAFGEEHPKVATSLNNLGWHYFLQGEWGRAEALNKRALKVREKTLGPDHRDVALSLHNLAKINIKRGEWTLAEPLLRRALNIQKNSLGEDHPDYAVTLADLGRCLLEKGEKEKGLSLLEQALSTLGTSQQKRSLREWNETRADLEKAYIQLGRVRDAEALKRMTHKHQRRFKK